MASEDYGLFDCAVGSSEEANPIGTTHALIQARELPISILEKVHDELVAYFNKVNVPAPTTEREKLTFEIFNGLLDHLESKRLGDPRRRIKEKGK